MMSKKLIIACLLVLCTGSAALAQQDVMFTQYMFNGLVLNPAYAGSHEALSATVMAREQWTGIDGAPSTQSLAVHSPLFNEKIALGALVINDNIGVTNETNIYFSYAYRIDFGRGKLSMALQTGLGQYNNALSEVFLTGGNNDNSFASNDVRALLPNFGAGLYYYTPRFYAGFSVPHILNNEYDRSNATTIAKQIRHYFFTTGYVVDVNHWLKWKPNLLVKAVEGAPLSFDINSNFLLADVLWLGASWRSFDSIDLLVELQINNQFRFGYAYDITTTELSRVNNGSHEIMLNYIFKFSKEKVVTPRYF